MAARKVNRKNMNISEAVFLQLDALRKKSQKRIGVKVSWDHFFADLIRKQS
jgi:hypothetical protein